MIDRLNKKPHYETNCPTCGVSFEPSGSPAMPFCSHRCRQIDLGRWFSEEIGLPMNPEDEEVWEPEDGSFD